MNNHFIHYVSRRVYVRKPVSGTDWYAERQKPGAGFGAPAFHLTRARTGATAHINKGDTIWLISELKSPWGKLSPALDAKVVVQKIIRRRNGLTKFLADPSASLWFPMANCLNILSQLETVNAADEKCRLIPLPDKARGQVGIYLQSIRQLHSADALQAWANDIQRQPLHFISYRIKDGTKCAFEKTRELIKGGKVVFWDRWSLPRRLAERREKTSGAALNNHLLNLMTHSAHVWGIESKLYAEEGSYSHIELAMAEKLGTYNSVRCKLLA